MFDFITGPLKKVADFLTNLFPPLRLLKTVFNAFVMLKDLGAWLTPILQNLPKLGPALKKLLDLIVKGGGKLASKAKSGAANLADRAKSGLKSMGNATTNQYGKMGHAETYAKEEMSKSIDAGLKKAGEVISVGAKKANKFVKRNRDDLIITSVAYGADKLTDSTPEKVESLEQKLDKLIELQLAQAQKAAEEKPKEGAPASVKESPHQIAYREGLKLDADLEQGATLLKAFFDELAPVTEQFGKLKEILSSLLAPEDMTALEAKTKEVAAKEGDATAQDFNGLIEMLKQLLEKVNVILDPETGLLSPKDDAIPQSAPATSGGNATGSGPSTVQQTQKKGEGIEAQLEAWDEIVRKFGENAVGAFQNMLESGEISIKGLTKMLVQMAKKALIMQVIPRLFGFNSFGTEAGGMFNGLFGKETGGRVSVGMPYLVGEKRPEIFIPDSPGVIAARIGGTGAKVAGAGNQAQVTQNINFTTDVANSVRAEIYNATPHIVAAAHQAVFDTLKGNRRY